MDRDEIIRIARDAKAHHSVRTIGGVKKKTAWRFGNVELERFAKLVALRYEKRIADLENIISQRHWDVLQEREACAKLVEGSGEEMSDKNWDSEYEAFAEYAARTIRARGV